MKGEYKMYNYGYNNYCTPCVPAYNANAGFGAGCGCGGFALVCKYSWMGGNRGWRRMLQRL